MYPSSHTICDKSVVHMYNGVDTEKKLVSSRKGVE